MERDKNHIVLLALVASVLAGGALAPAPAFADLVAGPVAPLPLTADESALLADNPDLAALATDAPWLLRQALDQIENSGARNLPRDGLGQTTIDPVRVPDPVDRRILQTNPNLRELWRLSPDPALALLQLMRAAAAQTPRLN